MQRKYKNRISMDLNIFLLYLRSSSISVLFNSPEQPDPTIVKQDRPIPQRPVSTIVKQVNNVNPDGSYQYR